MANGTFVSQTHSATDLIRVHRGTSPVVEVILQISISYAKLELLQKDLILHQIQSVEHIKTFLLKIHRTRSHKLNVAT